MQKHQNPVVLWSQINLLLSNQVAPCANEFRRGTIERSKYPLNSGIYKLNEFIRESNRCVDEFRLLALQKKHSQPLRGLCTYGDHASWIKNRPTDLAFEAGWKLFPAIVALGYGEVPEAQIRSNLHFYFLKIAELINSCEEALPKIKAPIRYEYDRWKNNESLIAPLYIEAINIAEAALLLTKQQSFA